MNDYQLGFVHACRLIKSELKQAKESSEILKLIEFVENEEIKAIRRDIGI